jgi:hypothetical protein
MKVPKWNHTYSVEVDRKRSSCAKDLRCGPNLESVIKSLSIDCSEDSRRN